MPPEPAKHAPRAIDRKLDPRISYLLGLREQGKLEKVKIAETSSFRSVDKEIRATRDKYLEILRKRTPATARKIPGIQRRIGELRSQLCAPITAGLHLPGDKLSLANRRVSFDQPFLSVLVLLSVPERKILEDAGAKVRALSGKVCLAYVTFEGLEKLQKSDKVLQIELARPISHNLGTAIPLARINSWHTAHGKGAGVIVGVIDDYIDVRHPDFCKSASQTRIRFLWDQTLEKQGQEKEPPTDGSLPGFTSGGGVEYTDTEIDAELAAAQPYQIVRHVPQSEHGTLVTGCAAGNGRAWTAYKNSHAGQPNIELLGAAPEADIIFVRHGTIDETEGLADSSDILVAFTYIFARAKNANNDQACVVNLSASDNQGGHDGTSPGEIFLDGLLNGQAGRAITLSAGNSHGTQCHVFGTVEQQDTVVLELEYYSQNGVDPSSSDAIEVWYEPGSTLNVSVTPPTPAAQSIKALAPGGQGSFLVGGVEVIVSSHQNHQPKGDSWIQIAIRVPLGSTVPKGTWTIELAHAGGNDATFHAWIDRNNRGKVNWLWSDYLAAGDDSCTIGVPSTGEKPITVGGHMNGNILKATYGGEASGRGPIRGGAYDKPELSAPDRWVMAPFPTNLVPDPTYPYGVAGGTSVAAPIVAGACALLFQNLGKGLLCDDIKKKLVANAKAASGFTKADKALGFGPLNMV